MLPNFLSHTCKYMGILVRLEVTKTILIIVGVIRR